MDDDAARVRAAHDLAREREWSWLAERLHARLQYEVTAASSVVARSVLDYGDYPAIAGMPPQLLAVCRARSTPGAQIGHTW